MLRAARPTAWHAPRHFPCETALKEVAMAAPLLLLLLLLLLRLFLLLLLILSLRLLLHSSTGSNHRLDRKRPLLEL